MSEELPTVIASNTVQIMGIDLTVHVLSDGQRVIDADSVEQFFAVLGQADVALTDDEVLAFAKVIRGVE